MLSPACDFLAPRVGAMAMTQRERQAMRATFERDGFILIRGVVPTGLLRNVQGVVEKAVDRRAQDLLDRGLISNTHEDKPFASRWQAVVEESGAMQARRSWDEDLISLPFHQLCNAPTLTDIVQCLLTSNERESVPAAGKLVPHAPYCTGNFSLRPKIPRDKRTTIKWHNDSMYSRNNDDRVLTCWLPLVPTDELNGCMQCLPQSHLLGPIDSHMDPEYKVLQPPQDFDFHALPPPVSFAMEPGDALVFTNFTLHRSLMNNAETTRWSIDLRYTTTQRISSSCHSSYSHSTRRLLRWRRYATSPVGEVDLSQPNLHSVGGIPGFRLGVDGYDAWLARVEMWRALGGDSNFGARLQAVGVPTLRPEQYAQRQDRLAKHWAHARHEAGSETDDTGAGVVTKLQSGQAPVTFRFGQRWGALVSAPEGLRLLWRADQASLLRAASAGAVDGELAIAAPAWVDPQGGLRWPVVVQHPEPYAVRVQDCRAPCCHHLLDLTQLWRPVLCGHDQRIHLIYVVVVTREGEQSIALWSTSDFVAFFDQGPVHSRQHVENRRDDCFPITGPPTIVHGEGLWHLLYRGGANNNLWHIAAPSPTGFVPSEGEGTVARRVPRPPRQVAETEETVAVSWRGDQPVAVSRQQQPARL